MIGSQEKVHPSCNKSPNYGIAKQEGITLIKENPIAAICVCVLCVCAGGGVVVIVKIAGRGFLKTLIMAFYMGIYFLLFTCKMVPIKINSPEGAGNVLFSFGQLSEAVRK